MWGGEPRYPLSTTVSHPADRDEAESDCRGCLTALQGLLLPGCFLGCPGVWSLWVSFMGSDGTFLFGGPSLPLHHAAPREQVGEFQSGAKGRAPLPPLIPAKAGGLGALRLRLPWPAMWSCTSDGVHSPGQSWADSCSRVLRTQVIPETPRPVPLLGFAVGPTHPGAGS